jgi:uncharacterized repeat protein (TIGR04138 family)
MSLRDDLAGILARDSRYAFSAYLFVLEALEFTKALRRKARARRRAPRHQAEPYANHVTGQELCEGARLLALQQYGMMALVVLNRWGIRSTADLGEIVFNLIAAGDLEKTPTDSKADFDNVYDFEAAFRREYVVPLDDVA